VYARTHVPVWFSGASLCVMQKMLGQAPGWRELCEAQPALARGLAALLAHEGPEPVEEVFCRWWGGWQGTPLYRPLAGWYGRRDRSGI
jgi:hypothetical protein